MFTGPNGMPTSTTSGVVASPVLVLMASISAPEPASGVITFTGIPVLAVYSSMIAP